MEVRRQRRNAARRKGPRSLDPATVMTPGGRGPLSSKAPEIQVAPNPLQATAIVASRSARTVKAGTAKLDKATSWRPVQTRR